MHNDLDDIEKGIRARQLRGMILPQAMILTEDEVLMKADKNEFSTEDREKLAKKKMAMPDGGYPIRSKSDLLNAIKSIGRAKDYEKAKKWVIRRAKELNAVESLPSDWNIKKAEADTIYEIEIGIEKGITSEDIYGFPKLDEIVKGKSFPVGTVKKWGENEYMKTGSGWKLVKKQGKEWKEPKEDDMSKNVKFKVGQKVKMFDNEPELKVTDINKWSDKPNTYDLESADGKIKRNNISGSKIKAA